jgi:hypothetical protein
LYQADAIYSAADTPSNSLVFVGRLLQLLMAINLSIRETAAFVAKTIDAF